ncbi:MAG: hypothetical protein WCX71_01885 [Candidatus Buchananbacteria bacterium]
MKKISKKIISTSAVFFVLSLLIFIQLTPVLAASTGIDAVQTGIKQSANKAGLSTSETDLATMLGRAINYLFSALGMVFMTIILVGGYLWMTAGGNEEKIGKAKGFIINGINGMIVIFLSYALVYTMLAALKASVGQ